MSCVESRKSLKAKWRWTQCKGQIDSAPYGTLRAMHLPLLIKRLHSQHTFEQQRPYCVVRTTVRWHYFSSTENWRLWNTKYCNFCSQSNRTFQTSNIRKSIWQKFFKNHTHAIPIYHNLHLKLKNTNFTLQNDFKFTIKG